MKLIARFGLPAQKLILIVEDEPKIAAFMQKGLNRSGFSTDVVTDGQEVIGKLLDAPFDLVLLDLGLPTQDGLEVLKEIRQCQLDIPIIVVTARSISSREAQVMQMSGSEIVSKPFLMKDLVQKVRSLLDLK